MAASWSPKCLEIAHVMAEVLGSVRHAVAGHRSTQQKGECEHVSACCNQRGYPMCSELPHLGPTSVQPVPNIRQARPNGQHGGVDMGGRGGGQT